MQRRKETQSLDDMFGMFILEKKTQGLSERTLEEYIYSYNVFKEFIKEEQVTKEAVVRFKNELMKSHNTPTINRRITDIRVFLYWCMQEEYLNNFKITTIKYQEDKIKFFSDEELEKLLKEPTKDASYTEHRTYMMICFILGCGCRLSTLINIKQEDIDFETNTISFRHLKTKKHLSVPLSETLKSVLKKYLKMWNITSEYLFCTADNKKMTVNCVELSFGRYCKARKVQRRGPHALRHNYARLMIKNGASPFILQQLLGHSDITMTRRYVRLFSDDLRDEVERCNPLDNFKSTRVTKKVKNWWKINAKYSEGY